MKKLLAFICLPIAMILAAESYQGTFNTNLSEGKFEVADSILQEWIKANPDDPELYPALFNLLINRARNQMMVLSGEPAQNGDELVLADSTGNEAGYIYGEVTWQDSLVDLALAEIDRGIAACPDRIDFRLGKAAAASITSRWNTVIDAVDGILDREAENGGRWLGNGNKIDVIADTLLAVAIYDRLVDLYNVESLDVFNAALPLAAKAAKRFNNDVRILNMAGSLYFGVGDDETAIRYFEEAAKVAPEDCLPLANIGFIYYQRNDTIKALEAYRKIENGNYDEECQNIAKEAIDELTNTIKDMREYPYFFRYLPQMASQTKDPTEFLNVENFNSRIPALNRMRSPFTDDQIKAEKIEHDGKTIVVWTFPDPKETPLCKYIAFVADGEGAVKVYTLEKSFRDLWVVGTMKDNTHSNYGSAPTPTDAAGFVKALNEKGLLSDKEVDPAAQFIAPNNGD